jgi:hypothetical protein
MSHQDDVITMSTPEFLEFADFVAEYSDAHPWRMRWMRIRQVCPHAPWLIYVHLRGENVHRGALRIAIATVAAEVATVASLAWLGGHALGWI